MNKKIKKAVEKQIKDIDAALKGEQNDYSLMRVRDIQELDMLLWGLLEGDWGLCVEIFTLMDPHVKSEFLDEGIGTYIEEEIQKVIRQVIQKQQLTKKPPAVPPNG